MSKRVEITHIQTGADRAAGEPGELYSDDLEQIAAKRRAAAAEAEARVREESARRGDRINGQPVDGARRSLWRR